MELEQIFKSATEKLQKADTKEAKKVIKEKSKMLKRIQNYTEKFLGKDFLSFVEVNYTLLEGYKEIPYKGVVEIKSKDQVFIVNFKYYLKDFKCLFFKTQEYLCWIDGFKSTDPEAREVFLKTFEYEWKNRKETSKARVAHSFLYNAENSATEENTQEAIHEFYKGKVPDIADYLGDEIAEVEPGQVIPLQSDTLFLS